MIPIHEAHIWWRRGGPVEVFDGLRDRGPSVGLMDTGACFRWWREASTEQLLTHLREFALDLIITYGCEPEQVIREFATIAEFRAEAANSYYLCRCITKAETGTAFEDTERFEET